MKYRVACLAMCFVFTFPIAAQAHRRFDGAWWNDQPKVTRLGIVDGLVDGFESGYFFARQLGQMSGAATTPQLTFKKNPEAYETAITNFYRSHPAAQLSPGDLMVCLADQPILSCDALAKPYESKK